MSIRGSDSVRWDQVTAIFGGTFDPPHVGHRDAALGLFTAPAIRRVIILPAAIPPHKPSVATQEERLEMTRKTFPFSGPKELVLDLREIERAKTGQRPSYSFETLQEMKREYSPLAFVTGADQLEKLHTWYRFPELLDQCHWIVLARKPLGNEIALRTLQQWAGSGLVRALDENIWKTRGGMAIRLVPTDAPALSSTAIRETIGKTGQPPEGSLTGDVLAYLKLHRIYDTGGSHERSK